MKFTVRHRFNTDLETYWTKVFFDEEYNRRLYEEALRFRSYKVIEQRDTGAGKITRTLKLEPATDVPAVIKKLLGDRFSYTEVGNFDPATKRWKYNVTPSVLPDKVTIKGDFWAEVRGPKEIERICDVVIEAKIFGVGGVLESFVEKETKETYEVAARFTADWIKNHGL